MAAVARQRSGAHRLAPDAASAADATTSDSKSQRALAYAHSIRPPIRHPSLDSPEMTITIRFGITAKIITK
ncbi:unnamed protein product, partial [Iphiclides podalirius]